MAEIERSNCLIFCFLIVELGRPKYFASGNGKQHQDSSNNPNPPAHSDSPAIFPNFLISWVKSCIRSLMISPCLRFKYLEQFVICTGKSKLRSLIWLDPTMFVKSTIVFQWLGQFTVIKVQRDRKVRVCVINSTYFFAGFNN